MKHQIILMAALAAHIVEVNGKPFGGTFDRLPPVPVGPPYNKPPPIPVGPPYNKPPPVPVGPPYGVPYGDPSGKPCGGPYERPYGPPCGKPPSKFLDHTLDLLLQHDTMSTHLQVMAVMMESYWPIPSWTSSKVISEKLSLIQTQLEHLRLI